jgi:Na+-driven multidrug efflux pump
VLKINRVIITSLNIYVHFIARIYLVGLVSKIDSNFALSTSHIMVLLGVFGIPYYFATSVALNVKHLEHKISRKYSLINTLISYALISILGGGVISLIAYYVIEIILIALQQPTNIVQSVTLFCQCYTFCIIANSLFYGLQQFYIGLNKGYIAIIVNILCNVLMMYLVHLGLYQQQLYIDQSLILTFAYLSYGLVGCGILVFLILRRLKYIEYNVVVVLKLEEIIKEIHSLLKRGFPFTLQNAHGMLVVFVHVITIGIVCPKLLPVYEVLIQCNLTMFIVINGGVQAIGLDTLHEVHTRQLNMLSNTVRSYLYVIITILGMCATYYYFKVYDAVVRYRLNDIEVFDCITSYFVAMIIQCVALIRNSTIMILTTLKDNFFPAICATSCSLCIGIPVSIYLAYNIEYGILGINVGVLIHYLIACSVLLVRCYKKWNVQENISIHYQM